MSDATAPHAWRTYPMGPTLRRYLGIADGDYEGRNATKPTPEHAEAFCQFLSSYIPSHPVTSKYDLLSLLEELVAMGASDVALLLHEQHGLLGAENDFRGLLALGSAAMMEEDLANAERWLRDAQALSPEEPSPYVNMCELLYHQERDDQALEWALAGLDAAPEHNRLWEMIAAVYQQRNQQTAGEELRKIAHERHSWAGLSLAAHLIDASDPHLRAQILEDLYREGERSADFLVELTAALGVAGQYDKIPPIVWRAEAVTGDPLPWQLYAHAAQSHLASGRFEPFQELMTKLERDGRLPEHARQELLTLSQEAFPELEGLDTHDHQEAPNPN